MNDRNRAAAGGGLIVLLATLTALSPFSIDTYLPALPALAHYFGVSHHAVQHSLSTFFAGLALGQLAYGPVSDRTGRRPVLFFGLALYLATSVVCALAPTAGVLIAGRFAQGLGAAAGPVVARAVVRDTWSGRRAARAISYVVMVMTTVPIVAPVVGGHLLRWFDWQSIFWLLTGFAVVCIGLVGFALAETNRPGPGPRSSLWHRFAAYAHLLRDARVIAYLVCGGAAFGVLFSFITGSSFVYIQVFGIAPDHFGYYFALNMVSILGANYLNGRLVTHYGYRRLLAIAAVWLLAAVLGLLACTLFHLGGLYGVIVPMFFATAGIGVVAANTVAGLLNLAPRNAGAASSLFGVAQFVFGALASVCVSALPTGPTLAMALSIAGFGAVSFAAQLPLGREGG